MRGKLFLVHWRAGEAEQLARNLRAAKWSVDIETEDAARAGRRVTERPPDAVVISLAAAPEQGLAAATTLRGHSAGRFRIVFVDGDENALRTAKARMPFATFTTSGELQTVLQPGKAAGWG
jgi:DNA-binding response OmpR family regulator